MASSYGVRGAVAPPPAGENLLRPRLGRRPVFLEVGQMQLLLRLLDVGEQAALTFDHALFGGDLQQARIDLPLLEDGGLLALVEVLARDDVGRVLEDAAWIC